jgi:hypothetical protein
LPAVRNTSRGAPASSKPIVVVTATLPTTISSVTDLRRFGSRNLMITMLLGGLWHGAAWIYVVWGALDGV